MTPTDKLLLFGALASIAFAFLTGLVCYTLGHRKGRLDEHREWLDARVQAEERRTWRESDARNLPEGQP